jgi:hypothetical protein
MRETMRTMLETMRTMLETTNTMPQSRNTKTHSARENRRLRVPSLVRRLRIVRSRDSARKFALIMRFSRFMSSFPNVEW